MRGLRRTFAGIAGIVVLAWSAPASAQPRFEVFTASFLNPDSTSSLLVGVELAAGATVQSNPAEVAREAAGEAAGEVAGEMIVRCEAVREGAAPLTISRSVRADALRVFTRMRLTPGHYTLTVTVQAGGGDAARSIQSVDVPFLATGQVSISDLLVSATKVGGTTAGVDEDGHLMPLVGHPPTARRTFTRDERLEIDAEIYQADVSSGADDDVLAIQGLSIVTSVLTEAGEVVYSMTESGQGETLPSGTFGYPHYTLVPIARLAPGRYVVQISAIDSGVSVSRSVPITVVDELR